MNDLLYNTVSALAAICCFLFVLQPQKFRYLLDKGNQEPSLSRIGVAIALVVSSWAMMTFVSHPTKALPEWFGSMYMIAFSGTYLGSIWVKMKGGTAPPENKP